jgi:chromate transporter
MTDLAWLTWTFLWLSFLSIGGGLGVLPELQRQVVHVHQWVTAQQFVDGYALAQLTPGPNMLVAVFVGYGAHGFPGAVLAGTAMFAPTSVLAALTARRWATVRERQWARVAERVIMPVGIGLMAGGAYTLLRSGVHDAATAAIALLALGAFWLRLAPPIVVVLVGGLAGWLLGV